ncbi:phage tail protein I [Nonomuraea longicatena]|uniref:Phage tail protein n=1 Tax=Nonomuraea longicatena TaxID=83682 RepID=A0ABN1NTY0_9ACTN
MRGALTHLASAHPLAAQLPVVLFEDELRKPPPLTPPLPLARPLTRAFDQVLAPVLSTLDCLDSYLDPALTPSDMLPWLASWVAIGFGEQMTEAQRRALVAEAVSLHRMRGTQEALSKLVRTLTGVEGQVTESGGVGWSTRPGGYLPGTAEASVTVHLPDETDVDQTWLEAVLQLGVPAHVTVTVTMLNRPAVTDVVT